MTLFKKILCFVVLAQITVFANNAMAECYTYYYISSLTENFPTATSAGTFTVCPNQNSNGGVYYNTATNTYVSVNQCNSCQSPGQLVTKTTTLNNGCVATYQDCDVVCNTSTTKPGGSNAQTYSASNCSSYATTSYVTISGISSVYWTVRSCNTCQSGYYRYATSANNGTCSATYYDCARCVKTPTYGPWRSAAGHPGYEQRTVSYTWNNSACGSTPSNTYEIRCAAGYYGTPTSVTSGCTKCGQIEGINSTSPAGSTSCTACCVSAGDTGSDGIGSFEMKTACCFTSC